MLRGCCVILGYVKRVLHCVIGPGIVLDCVEALALHWEGVALCCIGCVCMGKCIRVLQLLHQEISSFKFSLTNKLEQQCSVNQILVKSVIVLDSDTFLFSIHLAWCS